MNAVIHELRAPGGTTVRQFELATHHRWQASAAAWSVLALVSVFSSPHAAQWLVVAGGAVAVCVAGRMFQRQEPLRRTRRGRVLAPLPIGLWLTVLAELAHATGAQYPSYADAVALAGYPFIIIGLLGLVRTRIREHPIDTLLVAAIVPTALGAFGWFPLVESMSSQLDGTERHVWLALAFLMVDALALAMLTRLMVLFRDRPTADRLLLAAFGALLGSHVSRAAAVTTAVVPAPFGSQTLLLVAFGLLATAVLHPSFLRATGGTRRSPATSRGHVMLMGVAVLVGPAVLVLQAQLSRWLAFTVGGTALVSLLVVAHLGRLVREHGLLKDESARDLLTGLANRPHFGGLLARAISRADEPGFAVGFIDLDRFKKVNDSLGHAAGDDLLCQVADRLSAQVRDGDVVARLAGDEFAVLLTGVTTPEEAMTAARRVAAAFDTEFSVAGQSLFITPSIGLALHPRHGTGPETLLQRADEAMYEAKRLGRSTIEVYSERLGLQAHQQLALETRLHIGVGNGELVVHYQPKVSLHSGRVTGVEALVRWEHPTIGLVPPGAFMRLAEETGLVAAIGERVLGDACRQLQAWRQQDFPDLTVSVNLSLRQFHLQNVVDVVSRALAESGLPPEALELELTESSDLTEAAAVRASLHALRRLGVQCSIDDFGTGYSGIAYLNDLPIDKIKLDRSFITSIGPEGTDAPLVRAMIAMAHSLGLEVIAEGVETPEQLRFLREQGCDTIQGYLFSRPLPAGQIHALLGSLVDGSRPLLQVVRANGVSSERELGERLWAEEHPVAPARTVVPIPVAGSTPPTLARRTLVLSSVAGAMAVPTLLGLTAASALPATAQRFVAAGFERIGATPPRPRAQAPAPHGRTDRPAADTPAPSAGPAAPRPTSVKTANPPKGGPRSALPAADPAPSPSRGPARPPDTGKPPTHAPGRGEARTPAVTPAQNAPSPKGAPPSAAPRSSDRPTPGR